MMSNSRAREIINKPLHGSYHFDASTLEALTTVILDRSVTTSIRLQALRRYDQALGCEKPRDPATGKDPYDKEELKHAIEQLSTTFINH